MALGQMLADQPRPFDRLQGIAAILGNPRRDRQHQRIEKNILIPQAVFDGQIANPLRDFDLQTRLFRYPLSYMIYSASFQGLPDSQKATIGTRLKDVLSGKDRSPDFAHLSSSDRTAILEILHDTKPLPGF